MKKQSAWPWLGLYVVRKYQRQRGADAGTWLIHFHVPARLRPADWAATIDLPVRGVPLGVEVDPDRLLPVRRPSVIRAQAPLSSRESRDHHRY